MGEVKMTGVLNVCKPSGFTSFDVIAKLRGITKERKIGHAGTLDPMATGVLPVFLGKATRCICFLPDTDKTYCADFALGKESDTYDCSGKVVQSAHHTVTEQEVEQALATFQGEIVQLPPMYSAVKVNGKRLYEIARAGGRVERKERKVLVHSLCLTAFDFSKQEGSFQICCSSGTYIRTICHDLGRVLQTGGIMTSLIRTRACGLVLENAHTLEEIQENQGQIDRLLLPLESVFLDYPRVVLNQRQTQMFCNGVKMDSKRIPSAIQEGLYRVYGQDTFLGIGNRCANGLFTAQRVLAER